MEHLFIFTISISVYFLYVFFLFNEKLISVTRLKLKKKCTKYCNVAVEIETKLGLTTRH